MTGGGGRRNGRRRGDRELPAGRGIVRDGAGEVAGVVVPAEGGRALLGGARPPRDAPRGRDIRGAREAVPRVELAEVQRQDSFPKRGTVPPGERRLDRRVAGAGEVRRAGLHPGGLAGGEVRA